ncbi:threo-3-hydroxy-L-aspartate ammonia-lyase [soil metagenome]
MSNIRYESVAAAADRIRGVAHKTPVLTSRFVNERVGAEVFFKCENFQRMGAFKFRGAYNALSRMSADQRARGAVTFSSGNHGQAIALSGRLLGIRTTVVMPQDAPSVKIDATRGYGAEVVLYDRDKEARDKIAGAIVDREGATLIPPFDHEDVIAGQGTAAMELFAETGPLDAFYVPVGGGGLISGCAIATAELSPNCRVIGVEPAAGDDANRSFLTKTIQKADHPDTIADGARTTQLGDLTFPIILQHVSAMTTVTDPQLLEAMFYLWERMKMIVEPTGALAAAAVFQDATSLRGKRVGVLISGGNADLKNLAQFL